MPGMIGLVSSNSKVHNVHKIQSLGHVGDILLIDSIYHFLPAWNFWPVWKFYVSN